MHRHLNPLWLILLLLLTGCGPAVKSQAKAPAEAPVEEHQTGLLEPVYPTLRPIEPEPTPAQSSAPGVTSASPEDNGTEGESLGSQAADSYCLWPGDNLTTVAHAAQVSLSQLERLNPDASQYAGSTIQLPSGSVPPERWLLPTPTVNSTADLPDGVSGYYLGQDNRHKRVALTFDIGYVPENQARMVWLHDQGISATFFVLGVSISRHPGVVTDVLANGHTLGNHSWDHLNFQNLHMDEIQAELEKTEAAVQAAASTSASVTTKPYFRAPFGAITGQVQAVVRQAGYQVIGWTVDSQDWTDGATGEQVYNQVIRHVCPGAIIAMHDANPANSEALPRIIEFLHEHGYQIVSLKELLGF